MCAWCPHVDIIGADFKVHLRTVHGYHFEYTWMARKFIVETARKFTKLSQCRICYMRALTEESIRRHMAHCQGRRQAASWEFVRGGDAGAFFVRHAAEMSARRAHEARKPGHNRPVKLWTGRSNDEGDKMVMVHVDAA